MNGLYNDNSMDALNLYSQRLEADRSRFTGGAKKGTKVSDASKAKAKATRERKKREKELAFEGPIYPVVPYVRPKAYTVAQRKKMNAQASRDNRKFQKLKSALEQVDINFPRNMFSDSRREVELSHFLRPKSRTTLEGRNYWGNTAYSDCLSAINDGRYMSLCDKLKPKQRKPPKPRKPKGAGLSGLGYGMGLSGLGYASASGLSASGGASMAKVAQMERWADYQNEIHNLRNMGHPYRQAQSMAKHILQIN